MRTLDYDLPAEQGGGKLVNFQYSRSLNELIGSWSAEVASGNFTAGDTFSVPCMKNGLIANVYKDPDGMIHLSGKDAGVRLMRTTPAVSTLAAALKPSLEGWKRSRRTRRRARRGPLKPSLEGWKLAV